MVTPRRWIHQLSGAMVIAAEERITYLHGRQAGRVALPTATPPPPRPKQSVSATVVTYSRCLSLALSLSLLLREEASWVLSAGVAPRVPTSSHVSTYIKHAAFPHDLHSGALV
jgi:hypothetical protein